MAALAPKLQSTMSRRSLVGGAVALFASSTTSAVGQINETSTQATPLNLAQVFWFSLRVQESNIVHANRSIAVFGTEQLPAAEPPVFGVAQVHIPEATNFRRDFLTSDAKAEIADSVKVRRTHFIVHSSRATAELAFQNELFSNLDKITQEAVLYIPGLASMHEHSVLSGAHLFGHLSGKMPVIVFDWASHGSFSQLHADSGLIQRSKDRFAQVLLCLKRAGVKKLHIYAYSLGATIPLSYLDEVLSKQDHFNRIEVDKMVLAAPAVERELFNESIERLDGKIKSVLAYIAPDDRALLALQRLQIGVLMGSSVPIEHQAPTLRHTELSIVDVSSVDPCSPIALTLEAVTSWERSKLEAILTCTHARHRSPRLVADTGLFFQGTLNPSDRGFKLVPPVPQASRVRYFQTK